jgi:multidrug resistance efflux pump
VDEQRAKWKQSQLEVERYRPLINKTISEVQFKGLEAKEESAFQSLEGYFAAEDKAQNELEATENDLGARREKVNAYINKAEQDVEKARTDVNIAEKELTESLEKRGQFARLDIKSPSRGRIQSIRGQAGTRAVKEGDKLFEVVPETDDLAVELNVRGVDAPLIHVGDPVRLQFEGWPAIQFVGWPSVAVGTFAGEVIAVNPTDSGKGIFKIIVGPLQNSQIGTSQQPVEDRPENTWPDSRYLRQGVRANGWVILKTVPLGYEIWRQLNGFPITLGDKEPGDSKSKDHKLPKMK